MASLDHWRTALFWMCSCHFMSSVRCRHFVWFASVLSISVFLVFHVSEGLGIMMLCAQGFCSAPVGNSPRSFEGMMSYRNLSQCALVDWFGIIHLMPKDFQGKWNCLPGPWGCCLSWQEGVVCHCWCYVSWFLATAAHAKDFWCLAEAFQVFSGLSVDWMKGVVLSVYARSEKCNAPTVMSGFDDILLRIQLIAIMRHIGQGHSLV